ncbi:MAG: antibiotic biosynthesis monooxygenase [Actinomycetia bacterium]|nr:antibiotic biosynthesis monooxygenase [Actinomycetes bacterium]
MVLEIADIHVRPGSEDEFIAAYRSARRLVAESAGCRLVRMTRGIESPSRFVLLVEWDDVAAHEHNFRDTERFPRWRAAIEPFFAAPLHVEHVADID